LVDIKINILRCTVNRISKYVVCVYQTKFDIYIYVVYLISIIYLATRQQRNLVPQINVRSQVYI